MVPLVQDDVFHLLFAKTRRQIDSGPHKPEHKRRVHVRQIQVFPQRRGRFKPFFEPRERHGAANEHRRHAKNPHIRADLCPRYLRLRIKRRALLARRLYGRVSFVFHCCRSPGVRLRRGGLYGR